MDRIKSLGRTLYTFLPLEPEQAPEKFGASYRPQGIVLDFKGPKLAEQPQGFSAAVLFEEAKQAVDDGKLARAISLYEELGRLNTWPHSHWAFNNLGILHENDDRKEMAEDYYLGALELNKSYPDAHYNLGCLLSKDDRVPEAMGHFQEVLLAKPDDAEAHYALANAYRMLEKNVAAISHYRQFLRFGGTDPHWRNLALMEIGYIKLELFRIVSRNTSLPPRVRANDDSPPGQRLRLA